MPLFAKPPLVQPPPAIAAVADYEAFARERMAPEHWSYVSGGAADEITLRANREAFDRLRLQGRVLQDVDGGHTRRTLFGHELSHPILLAPVAYQQLMHPEGELATARAASAMRTPMVLSCQSSHFVEDVAAETQAPLWFQLLFLEDRAFTLSLARRAVAAGCTAIVLTVDATVSGLRHREQRAGFRIPDGVSAVNLAGTRASVRHASPPGASAVFGSSLLEDAPTWKDVAWLRGHLDVPLLLKGVLSPADAARAIDEGVDGLIVSNHGGRTLDTLPATIDALPAVAARVAGRVPILVDGGIRRGTDVIKALALGASAVLVGRPYVWGLAAAGSTGVAHVINMLHAELEIAMALSGCRTLADISPAVLWRP